VEPGVQDLSSVGPPVLVPRPDTQRVTAVKVSRTAVSPREIAELCGPPFTEVDIFEIGDEMGLKGTYNRYRRLEARLIVAKLMVRASSAENVERLLGAYTGLAGKSETKVQA
jgi:hypothetical protein